MSRSWILGFAFLFASADALFAQAKGVEIAWFGQSFFTVKSSKGTVVAFDPHLLLIEYGRLEGHKADIICISHNHNDHTRIETFANAMDKNLKIFPGLKLIGIRSDWNPVDATVKDVTIRNVGSYHDTSMGLERGKNSIFIIEVDGWKICHLGDLGHELSDEQLRRIGSVDVLMIPVGGVYTLNGTEANKVVEQIKPKEYVFPMHYGNKVYEDLLTADEFVTEFLSKYSSKEEKLKHYLNMSETKTIEDDNVIELNRNPGRPRPLLVKLHYFPRPKAREK